MYERYVVRPVTRPPGALAFHNDAAAPPGTPLMLMNAALLDEADVVVNARLVDGPPASEAAAVELHRHDVSQTYVLLSAVPGTLTAELVIEGETFQLASPVSAFIPPMARHSLRVTGGPGTILVVMPLKGDYNAHTFA